MIDLKNFYNERKSSYYAEKYPTTQDDTPNTPPSVLDGEDAIRQFRNLAYPHTTPKGGQGEGGSEDKVMNVAFILICNYLDQMGYLIEEFPDFLSRPKSLNEFSYGDVRGALIAKGASNGVTVRWADRRAFVDGLHFRKKDGYCASADVRALIRRISTSGTDFSDKSPDELLEDIANAIENLLKKNGRFQKIGDELGCGLLGDEDIKKYRAMLQDFRHREASNIQNAQSYSEEQKHFLVRYGCMVLGSILEHEEGGGAKKG
ncbi:MAG: hypothetical protein LKG11_01625 [Bacilli bacterium]|jgi:hypothetical protein|nr:hypothetical protein [Bacilli bacterium]